MIHPLKHQAAKHSNVTEKTGFAVLGIDFHQVTLRYLFQFFFDEVKN